MAPGLPDRVDCAHLADDAVVLERVYPLADMPRLQDLLADARGSVRASFAFANIDSGRTGATVAVEATPRLVCQRCLQGFAFAAAGSSEIEFSSGPAPSAADSGREVYTMDEGLVSLRELAEEELLLALPMVAACSTPQTCGRAPAYAAGDEIQDMAGDRTRPFAGLQDLLKKT
ncbi:MAG TPA: YceD family protein [Steroidobacteraceae bacterium]|nr:YceD family protein [Steroidobacteraceae bacterium]